MLKRTLSALVLSAFTASTLTACGSNTDANLVLPAVQTAPQVQAESYKGVATEIKKTITAAFKDMDKNKNKFIEPSEYEVKSPEQATSFYALDDNKDGKVTLNEMLPNFFGKIGLNLRLQKTAGAMFSQLDKNKDKYLSQEELNSPIVSAAYLDAFKKYDKEKQWWFFNKGTKGKLSKSEFENMYAHIAMTALVPSAPAEPPAPAPDPAPPAPGGDTPAPAPATP